MRVCTPPIFLSIDLTISRSGDLLPHRLRSTSKIDLDYRIRRPEPSALVNTTKHKCLQVQELLAASAAVLHLVEDWPRCRRLQHVRWPPLSASGNWLQRLHPLGLDTTAANTSVGRTSERIGALAVCLLTVAGVVTAHAATPLA